MSNAQQTKWVSGFTMIELMIVIVIIGILAAIAFPSYQIQMLKIKSQGASRNLMVFWEAQKEYYRENGVYASAPGQLDVEIEATSQGPFVVNGAGGNVAQETIATGAIMCTLFVRDTGSIVCLCPADSNVCVKLGIPGA